MQPVKTLCCSPKHAHRLRFSSMLLAIRVPDLSTLTVCYAVESHDSLRIKLGYSSKTSLARLPASRAVFNGDELFPAYFLFTGSSRCRSAALAAGYLLGKLRVGTFVLGPVAATLLVAIAIGQIGVSVSGEVKTLAFALFIYALGYMIGPQFVSSLSRATLKQVHLTILSTVVVVITVWGLASVFGRHR
jgi:Predicted Permease Membrane Region